MIPSAHPTTGSARAAATAIPRYTWLIGVVTVACTAGVGVLGAPSQYASAVIMLLAVGFVGLPHGAYDLEVARSLLSDRLGSTWWIWFGGSYLTLACLALALWLVAPWVGLTTLLLGGAIHWGADDLEIATRRRGTLLWLAASRGAVPVAGPMLFASSDVAEIFRALMDNAHVSAESVRALGGLWLALAAPGIGVQLAQAARVSRSTGARSLFEVCVLLAWLAVAPPVLAFTLYFCFWHSVRHSMRSALSAHPTLGIDSALARYARAAAFPTILTWGIGLIAAVSFDDASLSTERMWQIVFVGLFALTVPHITLELVETRAKSTHAPRH